MPRGPPRRRRPQERPHGSPRTLRGAIASSAFESVILHTDRVRQRTSDGAFSIRDGRPDRRHALARALRWASSDPLMDRARTLARKGFTLVELMVVVAILGVLA